jgi:hypothetical protein
MEVALRVLLAAGPDDDPAWDEQVRGVVSLVTAMLCRVTRRLRSD